MVTFTCECCGITKEFASADEAFHAGWDSPPYFTQVVCCDLCPSSHLVMGEKWRHDEVHKRWETEGRPTAFSLETCVREEDRKALGLG